MKEKITIKNEMTIEREIEDKKNNNNNNKNNINYKKRILEILKGIITVIIFLSSGYLQIIPILLFNIDVENYTASDLAIVNTVTDIILLIILIALYHKELIDEFKSFKKNYKNDLDTGLKYWVVGLIVMCVSNIIIGLITPLNTSSNEEAVQGLITATPYLMLLTAGIIAPITEELTFRKGISKIFKNKWVYAIASGLIFGFLHVMGSSNPLEYLYIIPYGSLGFFFALTCYETKNIYPSICMHAIHNSALVLLSIFTF